MTAEPPALDIQRFYQGLSRRYLGAGALVTDPHDRILIVEPVYKDTWEIPGGLVEAGEAPRKACERELLEELGIPIVPGRLLVMDHQSLPSPRGDSIMFVFDGATINDPAMISLQATELRSFRFVPLEAIGEVLAPRLASRVAHAVHAKRVGVLVERHDGEVLG